MFGSVLSVSTRNALSQLGEATSTASSQQIGGFGGAAASAIQPASAVPQASFGDVLAQMTGSVTSKLGNAEAMSIQGINGDANVRDVVSSVMEAEQSLQTAIAIRDKIVQAYLEISRMPI